MSFNIYNLPVTKTVALPTVLRGESVKYRKDQDFSLPSPRSSGDVGLSEGLGSNGKLGPSPPVWHDESVRQENLPRSSARMLMVAFAHAKRRRNFWLRRT